MKAADLFKLPGHVHLGKAYKVGRGRSASLVPIDLLTPAEREAIAHRLSTKGNIDHATELLAYQPEAEAGQAK